MDIFERKPGKIAVFRALQIGDLLVSVPAFRALRAAFPEAQIALVGLPWAREFVKRFSMYLDEWIEFPGYPGFPEREPNLAAMPVFFSDLQGRRLDLAIQMHGSGTVSNGIVAGFQARITAGFRPAGITNLDPAYSLEYPDYLPEPMRHVRLMERLGVPSQGTYLEFPIFHDEWRQFEEMVQAVGLAPGGYICIHPGARADDRRWPPERFATVADRLAAIGWPVVITGSEEDTSLAAQVTGAMQHPPVNLVGRTSLGVAAAWISQSALLVCNDTGVSHLAAALSVPSLVLFSNSDPLRWGPLNRRLHQVIPNATLVTAEEVVARAARVLAGRRPDRQAPDRIEPVVLAKPVAGD